MGMQMDMGAPTVQAKPSDGGGKQSRRDCSQTQTKRPASLYTDGLNRKSVSENAKQEGPSRIFWGETPEDRAFLIAQLFETSETSVTAVLPDIDPEVWYSDEVKKGIQDFIRKQNTNIYALVQRDQFERLQIEWTSGLNGCANRIHLDPLPPDVVHGGTTSNVVVSDGISYGIEEGRSKKEIDIQFGNKLRSQKLADYAERLKVKIRAVSPR